MSINSTSGISGWYQNYQTQTYNYEAERQRLITEQSVINSYYKSYINEGLTKDDFEEEWKERIDKFKSDYTEWENSKPSQSENASFKTELSDIQSSTFWTEKHETENGNTLSIYDILSSYSGGILSTDDLNNIKGGTITPAILSKITKVLKSTNDHFYSGYYMLEQNIPEAYEILKPYLDYAKDNIDINGYNKNTEEAMSFDDVTNAIKEQNANNVAQSWHEKTGDSVVYKSAGEFMQGMLGLSDETLNSLSDNKKATLFNSYYLLFEKYDTNEDGELSADELKEFYLNLDESDGEKDGCYDIKNIDNFISVETKKERAKHKVEDFSDYQSALTKAYNDFFKIETEEKAS